MSDRPPVPPQDPRDAQQHGPAPQWTGQPTPSGAPYSAAPSPAAPSAPAPSSDPFGRLLRTVPGRDWLASVLAPLGGWVAAYVVAALSLLLTVALAAAAGSGSGAGSGSSGGFGTDSGAASAAPDVQTLLSGISVLLGAPAQLVAMADFGRLHGSGSVVLLGSGSGSIGVVPVLVLAAQVVLAVVLTRRLRTRALALPQLVVTSVLSGLVLTALTTLTGLVLAIRFPATTGLDIDPVHAVGLGSILGSFVIGTLTAFLARPSVLTGPSASGRWAVTVARVLGVARIAASQLVVLVVLVAVVVIVVALVAQPSWGAALPLLIGNLSVALTALGFLGGVGTSGFGDAGDTASVFSGAGGWTWLAVLVVLVTAVLAGLAVAVRRNDRVRTALDWVVTPAVWLVAGIVVFVLGTGVVGFQLTAASALTGPGSAGVGSLGVTPWTPVVFALWGAAIEAVARFLAPVVLPRIGSRPVLVLARLVGTDPRPAPVAPGAAGAPQPFPGAAPVPGAAPAFPGSAPSAGAAPAPGVGAPVDGSAPGVGAPVDGSVPGYPGAAGAWSATPQPFVGAGAAPVAPMSPKAKKVLVRSLVAGGVVIVVVIAGAVTTSVLRANVWGPAPTVRSYVGAIARGDARAAEQLSEVPENAGMLDSAVLKSAKNRPTDVRVGRIQTNGDRSLATVTYEQGGKNRSGQVELRRTGTSFLVKDEWRVTRPLADTVSLYAADELEGSPVTVGGKEVGTVQDGKYTSLAYPGTYSVEVGGTKYFTGGTKSVTVGSASSPYVDFEPKATKQLTTDAEQYVTDLIETCAAKTDVDALDGCPWYGPYDADGPVRYKVTTMPELEVEASGSGSVSVESTKDGVIGYDYKSLFGDSGHAEDTFDVHEYLKVQDGKLVSGY